MSSMSIKIAFILVDSSPSGCIIIPYLFPSRYIPRAHLSNGVEVDGGSNVLIVAQRRAVNDDAAGLFDGWPIAGELFRADFEVLQVFYARLFQLLAHAG